MASQTQPTQKAFDPRRAGKQNTGFSDDEISDIICLLVPISNNARSEVYRMHKDDCGHTIARREAERVDIDYHLEDDAQRFGIMPHGAGDYAILLRLSADVKEPNVGFTFGRNPSRCDICLRNDPFRRLSNVHFRIYINEYGVLMLEDQSTNGTVVDSKLLKSKSSQAERRRTLDSGISLKILLNDPKYDLEFIVRIPRRTGEYETAYTRNLTEYKRRQMAVQDEHELTIVPGPRGPINLFPPGEVPVNKRPSPDPMLRLVPREWDGSEKYSRGSEIGRGAFATVYKVTTRLDGVPYAAKELDKRKFMKNGVLDQKVENEMRIMQQIRHPNIVQYIEHIDWGDRLLIIIMEYVPGGDLNEIMKKHGTLTENATKIMARQLLGALDYLHSKNITHRDVKPDNILISSLEPFTVKLTDFGLSKMIDTEKTFLQTFCGTLLYCAPEVYGEYSEYDESGRRLARIRQVKATPGQRYDHAVDVWSLGGVLHFALTNKTPYPARNGTSYSELLHAIMTRPLNVRLLHQNDVSGEGVDFLSAMLVNRPEKRATIECLLQHAWLNSDGAEAMAQQASQLSLEDAADKENHSDDIVDTDDTIDQDLFDGFGSQKNHFTSGPGLEQQRLFGQVGVSAAGSSGVMPSERPKLTDEHRGRFGTADLVRSSSQSHGTEWSSDSDESSTPRQKAVRDTNPRLSQWREEQNKTAFDANHSLDLALPSPGGTASFVGRVNVRRAQNSGRLQDNDVHTSKRKPKSDSSDDFALSSWPRHDAHDRHVVKRPRSEGLADVAEVWTDDGNYELYAQIPTIARGKTSRHIDHPVHKAVYWSADDQRSWHLQYPEMTQLQLDAFKTAAKARGEEFDSKSPLWALAAQHFPPAHYEDMCKRPRPVQPKSDALSPTWPSVQEPLEPTQESLPQARAQAVVPVHLDAHGQRIVAWFLSGPRSQVPGISIFVTESLTSWGRALDNTRSYGQKNESRVPRHGFKLLLWRERGYDPSRDHRPWTRETPDAPSSYYFYISSKAQKGIYVNKHHLPSHNHKEPKASARHWMRLFDGDQIDVWRSAATAESQDTGGDGNGDAAAHLKNSLVFRCEWGGSARRRPYEPSLEEEPETVATRLDEACARAERRVPDMVLRDRVMAEATRDADERRKPHAFERERGMSRKFETVRADAVRTLAARAARVRSSRSKSPASVLL